ncbi:hypothetical protein HQ393_04620 [Chitinibacter bivalviorum]|uniref:Uncharacterized protein n=1 Tax=Chitinibacter bivalviorum TaxID=2739434 RepID=A0A7H9BG83_9NEIS|nr:hypothetical protein [Chitinibacter bivalviorum]QLG87595.1 hypothetical protein HQ393_04620 [Chitinibacter bivalviorum]
MFNSSKNLTTQNITNNDNRQSIQDGMGISGDNSSISTTSNVFTDLSNRSTNNIDNSNRSVTNITNTTTDQGALKLAADQVFASLTSQNSTVSAMARLVEQSQKNAGDTNIKVINSAFDALGTKDHITADLVNKYADLQNTATNNIATAWKNAKEFEAGKSLGDIKWVIGGLIGVFALMALKGGK